MRVPSFSLLFLLGVLIVTARASSWNIYLSNYPNANYVFWTGLSNNPDALFQFNSTVPTDLSLIVYNTSSLQITVYGMNPAPNHQPTAYFDWFSFEINFLSSTTTWTINATANDSEASPAVCGDYEANVSEDIIVVCKFPNKDRGGLVEFFLSLF